MRIVHSNIIMIRMIRMRMMIRIVIIIKKSNEVSKSTPMIAIIIYIIEN